MGKSKRYLGDWSSVDCTCDITDKEKSVLHYVQTMFNRTNQMFEYDNLPDTIPVDMLELFLQANGHICITEVNGKLYALCGNSGGAPDPYYRDTLYVVASPALGYSASLEIINYLPPFGTQSTQGKCVVIKNDTSAEGLMYLYSRYASQMTENDISIRSAQINSRQQTVFAGCTDRDLASANIYLDNLEKGRIVAVQSTAFMDGMQVTNVSTTSADNIIQLIELQQYLKASWFNEIGLNANFNMKREYLSEEEIAVTTDVLLPLIDDMLICRERGIEFVNKTYGTNIKVRKNSAWKNKQDELNASLALNEAEVEAASAQNNS